MVDQEMLAAISNVIERTLEEKLNEKFEKLEKRLDSLEKRMDSLEKRMDSLEKRMDSLEKRMDSLEKRMDSLEKRMDSLEKRVDSLEKEVRRNSVILENEVLPRLQTVEQCYVESSRIFMQKADQIDKMQDDIDVMKVVIQEHSCKLEMIS